VTVGELIKELQKYDKGLPVAVAMANDLPFRYDVTGAELSGALTLRVCDEEPPETEEVNLRVTITPL